MIGHSATKWALDHILEGTPLVELVEGSFRWQPGWQLHAARRLVVPDVRSPGPIVARGCEGDDRRVGLPVGFAGAG